MEKQEPDAIAGVPDVGDGSPKISGFLAKTTTYADAHGEGQCTGDTWSEFQQGVCDRIETAIFVASTELDADAKGKRANAESKANAGKIAAAIDESRLSDVAPTTNSCHETSLGKKSKRLAQLASADETAEKFNFLTRQFRDADFAAASMACEMLKRKVEQTPAEDGCASRLQQVPMQIQGGAQQKTARTIAEQFCADNQEFHVKQRLWSLRENAASTTEKNNVRKLVVRKYAQKFVQQHSWSNQEFLKKLIPATVRGADEVAEVLRTEAENLASEERGLSNAVYGEFSVISAASEDLLKEAAQELINWVVKDGKDFFQWGWPLENCSESCRGKPVRSRVVHSVVECAVDVLNGDEREAATWVTKVGKAASAPQAEGDAGTNGNEMLAVLLEIALSSRKWRDPAEQADGASAVDLVSGKTGAKLRKIAQELVQKQQDKDEEQGVAAWKKAVADVLTREQLELNRSQEDGASVGPQPGHHPDSHARSGPNEGNPQPASTGKPSDGEQQSDEVQKAKALVRRLAARPRGSVKRDWELRIVPALARKSTEREVAQVLSDSVLFGSDLWTSDWNQAAKELIAWDEQGYEWADWPAGKPESASVEELTEEKVKRLVQLVVAENPDKWTEKMKGAAPTEVKDERAKALLVVLLEAALDEAFDNVGSELFVPATFVSRKNRPKLEEIAQKLAGDPEIWKNWIAEEMTRKSLMKKAASKIFVALGGSDGFKISATGPEITGAELPDGLQDPIARLDESVQFRNPDSFATSLKKIVGVAMMPGFEEKCQLSRREKDVAGTVFAVDPLRTRIFAQEIIDWCQGERKTGAGLARNQGDHSWKSWRHWASEEQKDVLHAKELVKQKITRVDGAGHDAGARRWEGKLLSALALESREKVAEALQDVEEDPVAGASEQPHNWDKAAEDLIEWDKDGKDLADWADGRHDPQESDSPEHQEQSAPLSPETMKQRVKHLVQTAMSGEGQLKQTWTKRMDEASDALKAVRDHGNARGEKGPAAEAEELSKKKVMEVLLDAAVEQNIEKKNDEFADLLFRRNRAVLEQVAAELCYNPGEWKKWIDEMQKELAESKAKYSLMKNFGADMLSALKNSESQQSMREALTKAVEDRNPNNNVQQVSYVLNLVAISAWSRGESTRNAPWRKFVEDTLSKNEAARDKLATEIIAWCQESEGRTWEQWAEEVRVEHVLEDELGDVPEEGPISEMPPSIGQSGMKEAAGRAGGARIPVTGTADSTTQQSWDDYGFNELQKDVDVVVAKTREDLAKAQQQLSNALTAATSWWTSPKAEEQEVTGESWPQTAESTIVSL
ncbi:unnamed protein product [Amoebophrya sp. A120]|nr:unnamed protein product [Amoebophrya sp. A120]|eukprot:GSA120T00010646001.1